MKTKHIQKLIAKYFEGETTIAEEQELYAFFEQDDIPEELESYASQFRFFQSKREEDQAGFDPFQKIDFDEKPKVSKAEIHPVKPKREFYRMAAGFLFLLMSFSIGLLLGRYEFPKANEVSALRAEVEQMRSTLISGPYRQVSASERILAVKQTGAITEADQQITDILIYVMNNDENVNVRIEAAEALARFADEDRVRKALIHSLTTQKDPTVQISLINLLVDIKASNSVREMRRMLLDTDTREEVKPQLEAAIASLAT
ncbi:MAG: HEAT repeat domain-containing protein [Balneolaceae bacterium]|nr:HEAT repeat domain-containing protein [Balneolaceae bacterium]